MLSLKRMNSKFFLLLFLIATFLTVCSFNTILEYSKSNQWIPVKHTESKMIYNFAESAARHYFVKQRKREGNEIEVCLVSKVSQKGKKYKLNFIANAKDCKDHVKDDCWQRLEATVTLRIKYTDSKMIYSFAATAARTYFLKLRKRDPNDIEVCQVTSVVQNGKKYKVSLIAKAKDCTREDIGDDCWQRLHAHITRRNWKIFAVVNVTKINNEPHEKSKCQFPQFNWDKF
uniref:Cystatin domain-containing protein n=2 Tax=Strongyloides stercoralis TaxID=6248 RepID=A0A0K0DZ74_STRER